MGNDTTGRRTTTYFAIVPEWLIGSVSANAIAVYCAIDRYADRDGYAFPSRKTLADRLDVSEPTVKRAVAELEKVGALVRFDRFRKDGSRTSNGYQLRRDPPDLTPPGVTGDPGAGVTGDPARNESQKEREEGSTPYPLVPKTPSPSLKTVARKRVTPEEYDRASTILRIFNLIFGTGFRSDDHRAKIILRLREFPDAGIADHESVIRRTHRERWWTGDPSPAVVYGNEALFERTLDAVRRGAPETTTRTPTPTEIAEGRY